MRELSNLEEKTRLGFLLAFCIAISFPCAIAGKREKDVILAIGFIDSQKGGLCYNRLQRKIPPCFLAQLYGLFVSRFSLLFYSHFMLNIKVDGKSGFDGDSVKRIHTCGS